uniref:Uncharacterized protein n=1 Tax=Ditylenchus dipsaci TaxID=166011 RepID=A0A915ELG3_9BILA
MGLKPLMHPHNTNIGPKPLGGKLNHLGSPKLPISDTNHQEGAEIIQVYEILFLKSQTESEGFKEPLFAQVFVVLAERKGFVFPIATALLPNKIGNY